MLPQTILSRAMKLLIPAGRWIQGEMAKNDQGKSCPPDDASACCWCIVGAIRLYGNKKPYTDSPEVVKCFEYLREVIGADYVSQWQDIPGRTLPEVMDAMSKAWKKAREDNPNYRAPRRRREI